MINVNIFLYGNDYTIAKVMNIFAANPIDRALS